jgi:hypothetical protein
MLPLGIPSIEALTGASRLPAVRGGPPARLAPVGAPAPAVPAAGRDDGLDLAGLFQLLGLAGSTALGAATGGGLGAITAAGAALQGMSRGREAARQEKAVREANRARILSMAIEASDRDPDGGPMLVRSMASFDSGLITDADVRQVEDYATKVRNRRQEEARLRAEEEANKPLPVLSPGQVIKNRRGEVIAEGGPAQEKSRTFEFNGRLLREQPDGKLLDVTPAGMAKVDRSGQPGPLEETKLRQQNFEAHAKVLRESPAVKDASELNRKYTVLGAILKPVLDGQQVKVGPRQIAALNSFQRMIDDAVVRSDDVRMILSSQGLLERFKTILSNLQEGDVLSPELTREMLETATDMARSINNVARSYVDTYISDLEAGGLYSPEVIGALKKIGRGMINVDPGLLSGRPGEKTQEPGSGKVVITIDGQEVVTPLDKLKGAGEDDESQKPHGARQGIQGRLPGSPGGRRGQKGWIQDRRPGHPPGREGRRG